MMVYQRRTTVDVIEWLAKKEECILIKQLPLTTTKNSHRTQLAVLLSSWYLILKGLPRIIGIWIDAWILDKQMGSLSSSRE